MYAGAPQTLSKIKQVKAFFFSNYFPNLEIIFIQVTLVWEHNDALNVLANQRDTTGFLFRPSYEGRLI